MCAPRARSYRSRHIRLLVLVRVLCLAGRAAVAPGATNGLVTWLCTTAPLWVVGNVCARFPRY